MHPVTIASTYSCPPQKQLPYLCQPPPLAWQYASSLAARPLHAWLHGVPNGGPPPQPRGAKQQPSGSTPSEVHLRAARARTHARGHR